MQVAVKSVGSCSRQQVISLPFVASHESIAAVMPQHLFPPRESVRPKVLLVWTACGVGLVFSRLCARRQVPSGTVGVDVGGSTSHAMRMEVAQSNVM